MWKFISFMVLAAMVLTACAPAATQTPVTEAPATTAPDVTLTTAPETVTLIVWDQFYRDVETQVMDTLNAEFEAAHPGVKIERVVKTMDDLKATLKLALGEADGPDVAQVNQGRPDMGAFVEAGLLLPLNNYATQYNWSERFSSSVNNRNSFSEDGKTFGSGNLYGVSPTAEVVGVYYNKNMFSKYGWDIPTTFDEFTQLLADIKTAGETPIAFGLLDGWPGIHEFSAVADTLVTGEYLDNFVYGVNNVSFDTPENQEAAKIIQEWVDAGYFTDGFMGIGYDDVNKLFKSGQGAMTITGSWLAPELLVDTDQEFGFFLLPQKTADAKQLAVGGVGIPFAIRKSTANPDLAAEYLDWMISPRAAQLWVGISYVPAMPLPADFTLEVGSLFTDTVLAWNRINQDNGVGHYIDWATPTFYDTIVSQLQKLFANEIDPATFTAEVEKDYSAFLSGQ
ncbi:MAG: ABC transporter substrate-binding protein [Anaerolineales bacterium]|nr:extracellular solute-binding protein [Anaerolineae bacterium]PWB54496.1 MAG: ABC transporter substrate-binding protein [Anaerolineales bacterium]